jgi:hypothetical protein
METSDSDDEYINLKFVLKMKGAEPVAKRRPRAYKKTAVFYIFHDASQDFKRIKRWQFRLWFGSSEVERTNPSRSDSQWAAGDLQHSHGN